METQNPTPPPKNSQFSKEEMTQTLQAAIQEAGQLGVTPDKFVQMGNFALQVVKNKSLYPIFTQALIQNQLADETDIPKKPDMQMLGYFAMLGKVAKQMTEGM